LTKPVKSETFAQAIRGAIHTHVVAQALAQHLPLLDACRRLMRATCKGLEWDFASIWVPSDGERMRCYETWARSGYNSTPFKDATRALDVTPGTGLPGRVGGGGSPEWIPDLSVEANFPRAPFAVASGLRSGFAVPFGAEGEVFAVLEFFSRSHRAPDLALLELFATSGAQMSEQVLRRRADQRALSAEAAKRSISVTLNAIMECAPALIIAVNEHGTIQFVNRDAAPYKREQMVGRDWPPHIPGANDDGQRAYLHRVLATGIAETYESNVVATEGTSWFTTHIGPMRDNDRVIGAVLVSQDVTELKNSQREVAAAQRLATVGTMAAGVAHEINTPVQFVNDSILFLRDAARDVFALVAKLQSMRRVVADEQPSVQLQGEISATLAQEQEIDLEYLNENVPNAFQRCLEGMERITTIVRSMKEFSHPAQREMAPVDLNRALQNTLTIARGEYKYVADLEVDLGEIPLVTCHINEINQVILNLVVNAAHAIGDVVSGTDRKGTITVRTRQQGEQVVISINDTGTGIPAAIAPRIFEPFFTTKEVGKGTGQGLALVWAVVREKHGGNVTFESKVGQGTTFFLQLPIAGKPSPQH
ncbi:MAG: PAS domain S-box protein, partial [Deltaproteobacteria bacterium]|nr:PAS domain S-box protein [Deltaproteobacteria bacterium]